MGLDMGVGRMGLYMGLLWNGAKCDYCGMGLERD